MEPLPDLVAPDGNACTAFVDEPSVCTAFVLWVMHGVVLAEHALVTHVLNRARLFTL